MLLIKNKIFKLSALSLAMLTVLTPIQGLSAEEVSEEAKEEGGLEVIRITGTRRVDTVQEAPINITALGAEIIAEQNIRDLSDVARWVPGLSIADQGGRSNSPIIVRGLNTNSSGPGSDGGTVATYVGEMPFAVDMRMLDIERIEVLIGPQGTLYGAGTLGGALRYIPKQVELDGTSVEFYTDIFSLSQGDIGNETGVTFNLPLIEDTLGVRIAVNRFDESGFIDYNYLVKQPGVSLPDPDWSDNAAVDGNLRRKEDANGENTLTAKIALRWKPVDWLDATLNYYYQDQEVEGRSISHYQSLSSDNPLSSLIGKYESGYRYEEPRDKEDSLLSLEVNADFGFADLVFAGGRSEFNAVGQRDQTDLLVRLDYSYEEFPAFAAYTREVEDDESEIYEVRLVSKGDSDLSWIVGYYFNKLVEDGESREFTPGYADFVGADRPDALEYVSVDRNRIYEKASFGELGYQFTDEFNITVGLRSYEYVVNTSSAIDLPLLNSWFYGAGPNEINLEFADLHAKDDGTLFKFNASYQFTPDVMGYLTVSEGFRIGGANGVAACPDPLPVNQIVCALPHERIYKADTTVNHEIGFKSAWFNNRLQFNTAIFSVDWDDPQVNGATENGQQPITANAKGAKAKGIEISSRALLDDGFNLYFSYSHVSAELTADAPFLFGVFDDQDSELQNFYDGKSGDRLSGAPETQASLGVSYATEVFGDMPLDIYYGITYQSDFISKVGLRADGETVPGYSLSNLSATLSKNNWSVTLYADNLFNKYAYSSVRRDQGDIGLAHFPEMNANGAEIQRNYGHFLLTPRQIGIRFNYEFDI